MNHIMKTEQMLLPRITGLIQKHPQHIRIIYNSIPHRYTFIEYEAKFDYTNSDMLVNDSQ